MKNLIRAAAIALGATLIVSHAVAASPKVVNCPTTYDPIPALQPLNSGPMVLAAITCLRLSKSGFIASPPSLSPDGKSFFSYDQMKGLWLGGNAADSALQHFEGRVTTSFMQSGTVPFAWSSDPRAVFGVKQETFKPNGWALGPLKLFLFSVDGVERALSEPTSPNGPLDEIFWIGDAGLALAGFGTKGSFYRPERADEHPTFAFVDARAGRVLQSIEIPNDDPDRPALHWVEAVASRIDDSGKGQVLIAFSNGKWLSWVQGEMPRVVPIPATRIPRLFTLSPDGRAILLMKNLSATGMACELDPKCPAPVPRSGMIAELRDIGTGKLIWSIDGTAKTFSGYNRPAISADGRYALVSMPPRDGHWQTTALVDMTSGKVLQEVLDPWDSECIAGFSPDGKTAWIGGGSRIVTYEFKPGQ